MAEYPTQFTTPWQPMDEDWDSSFIELAHQGSRLGTWTQDVDDIHPFMSESNHPWDETRTLAGIAGKEDIDRHEASLHMAQHHYMTHHAAYQAVRRLHDRYSAEYTALTQFFVDEIEEQERTGS